MRNQTVYKSLLLTPMLLASFAVFANKDHAKTKEVVNPDNTAINERDRMEGARTADAQMKGSERDSEITRTIRQELLKEDGLSVNAQNIKIVTINGNVTLRGPVQSRTERARAAAVASRVAGSSRVVNELEVARQ